MPRWRAAGFGMPWTPRGTRSAAPTHAGSGVAGICRHLPDSERAGDPDAMDATAATRMLERRAHHVRGVSDAFGIEKIDPAEGEARDVPRPDPTGSDVMRQSSAGHEAEGSWSARQRGIGNGARPGRQWRARRSSASCRNEKPGGNEFPPGSISRVEGPIRRRSRGSFRTC